MLVLMLGLIGLIHVLGFVIWAACGGVLFVIYLQRKPLKTWLTGFFGWLLVCAGLFFLLKESVWLIIIEFYLSVGARMMQASLDFGCMVEYGPKLMFTLPSVCQGGFFN